MDSQDPFNPPWNNLPNDAPRSLKGSHLNTIQHHGALPAASTSPYTPTTPSVPQGQFHSHAHPHDHHASHQTPVVSPSLNVLHPSGKSRPGSDRRPSSSDHQRWVSGENGGSGGYPSHAPQNDFDLDLKLPQPHRLSHHDSIPSNIPLDPSPQSNQYCRIPGCRNRAYYNFAEQEQTEYCGHGHELQAITTGLVNSCAMCKQRPRRTGERVCGRTCRERDRQATQIQGSYYGVPVVRREPKARPGT